MNEKTLKDTTVFDGHLIRVHVDDVELDNGMVAKREIVSHPGGVSVAILTEKNELLFVKQFRCPYQEELLELPAGKLEPGEDPFEAMKREQLEETGTTGKNYISLGNLYPTPGYCGEIIRLWACRVDKETGELSLDPDEFLQTLRIPLDKAVEMAKSFTANAPIAVKYAKACIDRGMQMDIDDGIAVENELFAMCFATEDQKEGMGAFLEKRKEKHFQNK